MTSLGGGGGGGGGQGEEQLRLLRHQPQMYSFYHVPQHSRREKLRFPQDDEPPPPPVASVLHEQSPLYPANSLAAFLPSVSYPYQGDGHVAGSASVPIFGNQIQNQGFSLTLSSQSRPTQLGPFTGYAAVLSRSRFLEPARKLLEEVCHVEGQGVNGLLSAEVDPPTEWALPEHGGKEGQQWRNSRLLLSLLDEVYRRYKHYYQQVQTVITSFESVAGLSTAAPFALMALSAMSKNFRYLKNSICHQFHQTSKRLRDQGINGDNISNIGLLETSRDHHQRSTCSPAATFSQPHVWRPQRGLPERAVSVLRSWLFEHFLHPYPTDVDKQNLAKQTGLTRNQVSNWFINARVRLWKPMVEDIYSLEMRQKNKMSAVTDQEQPQPPSSCMTNPVDAQISLRGQDNNRCSSSRGIIHGSSNNLAPMPNHMIHESVLNFVGHDISNHDNVGVGIGVGNGLANGVSLTLGLHQNNGVCFAEHSIPLTVPRRFGLDECTETYMATAFGAEQERQLVKDVGGRLLHDFVG